MSPLFLVAGAKRACDSVKRTSQPTVRFSSYQEDRFTHKAGDELVSGCVGRHGL